MRREDGPPFDRRPEKVVGYRVALVVRRPKLRELVGEAVKGRWQADDVCIVPKPRIMQRRRVELDADVGLPFDYQ